MFHILMFLKWPYFVLHNINVKQKKRLRVYTTFKHFDADSDCIDLSFSIQDFPFFNLKPLLCLNSFPIRDIKCTTVFRQQQEGSQKSLSN